MARHDVLDRLPDLRRSDFVLIRIVQVRGALSPCCLTEFSSDEPALREPRRGLVASATHTAAVKSPSPNPRVVFQKLDDGAVLFAPDTELYFGLNELGQLVWQLLAPSTASLDEIAARVLERHPEVPLATIRADVEELIESLVAEGLAVHADTAA